MKIIKLKKIKDKRGFIADLIYKKKIKHASLIISKKGSIRGNNYFKTNAQYIFNLDTDFEYLYKNKNQKTFIKKKIIKKFDLIYTPPQEIHALKFKKKNSLLEFSTLTLKSKIKKKDSVKEKII